MKEKIKELRVRIDGLSQLVKELKGSNIETIPHGDLIKGNSKEVEKAYDSLILAKAWLGKVLGGLGEETPYKNDGNRKEVKDIEPTNDESGIKTSLHYFEWTDEKSHIEKVDWLREEINKTIETLLEFCKTEEYWKYNDVGIGSKLFLFRNLVLQHLSEARFWLGFELSHIKEEYNEE